jgi:hypothetical protein
VDCLFSLVLYADEIGRTGKCVMISDDDNSSNARVILALMFLACVGAFFFLGAKSLSSVFGSKHAYRPTPDADGKVEVVILYSRQLKNPNPSQWKIKIPHGFIESVVGDLENVGPQDFVSVHMVGNLTHGNGGSFAVTNERFGADIVYLYINNRTVEKSRSKLHSCLSSASNSVDLKNADLRLCETKNCRIYDVIDGWNVEYSVSRSLAINPQPICNIFRAFLNAHTIKRDNILNKGN